MTRFHHPDGQLACPWMKLWMAFICAAALACAAEPAAAQGVPSTVKLPTTAINLGATSFLDGFGPTNPGFSMVQYLRFNDLNAIKDNNGNNSPYFVNPDITSAVAATQLVYLTPFELGGGKLGIQASLPFFGFDSSTDMGGLSLNSKSLGVGDLTTGLFLQMPPVIENGRPVFSQRFEVSVIIPTGTFDRNYDVNASSGFYSINPYWAFTILPTPELEFTARLNYLYNFESDKASNPPSYPGFQFLNGQAGQAVWANFAASYQVMPKLRLGVNGFALFQITDDKTNGISVSNSKEEMLYLGPGLSWNIDMKTNVNFNTYFPITVHNYASGPQFNIQVVFAN